jgi:outer membrane protein assembly factor BamB
LTLPGKYKWRGSPTAGDGKIYFMNHNGMVLVVSATKARSFIKLKWGMTYDDNTSSSVSIAE